MIKKFAVLLPLAVAVLGSSAAMAANDASTTINIKADIPTKQFSPWTPTSVATKS
jgi:hypothetical protein